jgi:hypothetical protein
VRRGEERREKKRRTRQNTGNQRKARLELYHANQ